MRWLRLFAFGAIVLVLLDIPRISRTPAALKPEDLMVPEKYKGLGFQNFATPNVEDMFKELSGTKK
jgi:hypothetical protein